MYAAETVGGGSYTDRGDYSAKSTTTDGNLSRRGVPTLASIGKKLSGGFSTDPVCLIHSISSIL
mgnify:CR=1 FL=1